MRFVILFLLGNLIISCSPPPTEFNEASLQDIFVDLKGNEITFESVLKKHKGKVVFIDIWASWCKDCIVGMPKVNELQKTYPSVQFVFLTVDHEQTKWRKGIEKFQIGYGDHYLIKKGWKKSPFCDFLDVGWIPRYIIINPSGKIDLFKATKATDKNIVKHLDILQ
ncbi:TlpA disulfide reductase family protein [Aquimarina sp. MMG016]|uniref:TlpA family protein disulfide reductase n=1 Tax=Aquimarina sp. MMG016 TaxID=2822690 RepID=UPI001B3A5AEE|nr:TlpA disulfide reductase family protein [Aquimarina sp. MMG016]MBQ4820522.1 TlpA family protein disulfide reductase [Aquimarina sp. MMG016]